MYLIRQCGRNPCYDVLRSPEAAVHVTTCMTGNRGADHAYANEQNWLGLGAKNVR